MYKVLIADDERLIRITLKNMIDWNALDCEVIATAKDGQEALELYKTHKPEIVITDLKMPGMDGITLIHKIRELNKHTQVIALSNYSDFNYVRDAMKAGAFDYLLKVTLGKHDLELIIKQAKESCVVTSESDDEESQLAIKALQRCLILTKNEHVLNKEEYEAALAMEYFKSYEKNYQIAYFRVDNINHLYHSKIKDHALLYTHIQDLIRESIPVSVEHTVLFISNHSGVVLFHTGEKLRVLNICNSIMRNIAQYLDIHVSITLSDALHSFTSFYEAFSDLLKSIEQRFYEGDGVLIQSEEHKMFHELNMNDISLHVEMLEAMRIKDFDHLSTLQEQALRYMKDEMIVPKQVLEYFIFILNNIEGNEIAKGKKHALQFDTFTASIRTCETLDKLNEILDESFQEIEMWLKDSGSNKYRQEVLDIIDYVVAHLNQRLTLKMIADNFDMSESSLSRMFKNETGKNLNYFINETKMKKAMDILTNEPGMIKAVASAVGMDDQLYFNKVFKKFYNVSPSEVRKKHKIEKEE